MRVDGRRGWSGRGRCWIRWGWVERVDHYPVQLSGGEQQRVALARAFILRPPIVLADEPTGNLDTVNGQHILELLLQLNRVEGTTLVLVTHDPALAAHAGRRITLRDGLVVSDEVQMLGAPVSSVDGGAFVRDGGTDCDAGAALVAGTIYVCDFVGGDWGGGAYGGAGIFVGVSDDAAAEGAEHYGGGYCGADVRCRLRRRSRRGLTRWWRVGSRSRR